MKRSLALMVVVVLAGASAVVAEEILLPGYAYRLGGQGGNLWTSEVFVTNLGPETTTARLVDILVGSVTITNPCVPPDEITLEIPPYATVPWPAIRLREHLGCPDSLVGALVIESSGPIVVDSRMVNSRSGTSTGPAGLPAGWGQEIPGVPFSQLPQPEVVQIVPGLAWHPSPCGPPKFETHLNFSNPSDSEISVTLSVTADMSPGKIRLDGREVTTPFSLPVRAKSWRQVRISPPASMLPVCRDPEYFDFFLVAGAPFGVYASVLDRTSQDPRTVLPLALQGAPAQ